MKTVPLHGAKAAGRVALVDDADYELVAQYHWNIMERKLEGQRTRGPYAITWVYKDGGRHLLSMHQLITGWPLTDHEDHDGLNNQRYNLRDATKRQNNQNSRSRLGSSSQYKGVYWNKKQQGWVAAIGHHGKTKWLGTFDAEKDAALAYDVAARELFGEFAVLNLPRLAHLPAPQGRRNGPPEEQDDLLLRLRDQEGVPLREIARRMGLPRTTVQSRYRTLTGRNGQSVA
jgi:hypothetical protein